jgi:hypothetical protein
LNLHRFIENPIPINLCGDIYRQVLSSGLNGQMSKSRFTKEYDQLLNLLIKTRRERKITQAEVAAHLGKPQSHVSKVELKDRELSITDLRKWCVALGLPLDELMRTWIECIKEENLAQ